MTDAARTRLLLVDDDHLLLGTLKTILELGDFEVKTASDVNSALKLIGLQAFDVLLSDLHMPSACDGLTVVSAMRNANPTAVAIILSAFPEMEKAAATILAQADDIFVKPTAIADLSDLIRQRLKTGTRNKPIITSVATILEEETDATIKGWLLLVDGEQKIISIAMDDRTRSAHLPQLFGDLVERLRNPLPLGSRALVSHSAIEHGLLRREQGYTAAMMVEESRMLQVSIFQTLQNNLSRVNFGLVLLSIMTIADEVDSQLAQAMSSYVTQSNIDSLPTVA